MKRGDIVPSGEHGGVMGPQVRGDGQLQARIVCNVGVKSRILIMHLKKRKNVSLWQFITFIQKEADSFIPMANFYVSEILHIQ